MSDQDYSPSLEDFRRARMRANLEEFVARLRGKSTELLSYEEVRQKLKAEGGTVLGLKEVPLDHIVGSVGRYTDFTRSFLPRQDADLERWARIKTAMAGPVGLPPIEVYKIGDAYFVLDGNHRVSAARQLGLGYIHAYVTEIHSRVPLSPDVQPDDLIIKAEYADFLERTRLDELVPGADLRVSVPGRYQMLLDHIEIHRYVMSHEQGRDVPDDEAATAWYQQVYLPVVQVIREQGLLRDFPHRTETDLYLWISEHRAAVEQELGWQVTPEAAAISLVEQFSHRPRRVLARVSEQVLEVVRPGELEPGPKPGEWRKERLAARRDERLFADILVAVNGSEAGWHALDQAIEVARRESARLHGLHVLTSEEDEAAAWIQARFDQRCRLAGVRGALVIEGGEVARVVVDRSWWTDLVVLSLSYPPAPQLIARLASGFRTILRRCPRPVLAVPLDAPFPERALLAYDGSRKAEEALFVASYLSSQWKMPLVVVTVIESGRTTADALLRAQGYLESRGVQATLVKSSGPVAESICKVANDHQSSLIIMGGYGFTPVLEVMLGSAVDHVLRASRRTVLICR